MCTSEDDQRRRVRREVVATTPTGLSRVVERYAERGLRVAIEAGNQTTWIVDLLRELGAKVQPGSMARPKVLHRPRNRGNSRLASTTPLASSDMSG